MSTTPIRAGRPPRARNRLRLAFALFSATLVGGTFTATTAEAGTGQAVTITLIRHPDFSEAGWTAVGAIDDGGTWTTDRGNEPENNTLFVVAAVWTTQTGTHGTFVLKFQGRAGTPAAHPFGGTWQFADGTGSYSALQGGGSWTEEENGIGEHVFTITGALH